MIALRRIHHVCLRGTDAGAWLHFSADDHTVALAARRASGTPPPRSFFRFDAAAVEAERHGLEAQGHALPSEGD